MSVNRKDRFQEEKGSSRRDDHKKYTRMVSEGKEVAVLGSCATVVKKPMLCKSCKQGDGFLESQEP